jgi:hypothetical protein
LSKSGITAQPAQVPTAFRLESDTAIPDYSG